ncbi:MAG: hypothetical protein O9331_03840 [Acidovorax sp.]|nr:hypothetical protein [Acidovorax sp.]
MAWRNWRDLCLFCSPAVLLGYRRCGGATALCRAMLGGVLPLG